MATDIGTLRGTIELNDKFSSTLSLAGSNLQKAGRNFTAVGGKMSAAGSSITRSIGLPLALASGAALKLSSDFETSLTKIQTLVGLSAKDVQGFRADILSLSGDTARAPKELADAMFFVTSAGLRGSEALDTLKFAAQAAAIGLGDTVSVADAVTSAMNAYGPATLSAERATNVLALAVRAGKLEASELAPVMGSLLPTASALGISFETVAGTLAVMSKTGVDASEGATTLSAIMTTLLGKSKEGAKALDGVGLSYAELRDVAAGPGGLVEAMRMINEGLGDNEEELLKVVPNIRAFRGAMNVLAQDADSVDDVLAAVASDTDVLGEGMKIVAETTGFKFNQFLAKLSATGIELGDTLVPAFETILEAGVGLLEWASKGIELFGKLPGPIQTTALAMLALGIAMGPVLFVGGNMFTMFGSMLNVMGGGIGTTLGFSQKVGGLGVAANAASRGLSPLASKILPNFLQVSVQGRNSLGQFGKSFKVFNSSILTTPITLTSVKTAMTTMGTAAKGTALAGITALKAGVISLTTSFMALSIGILGPVAIVAALAIFSVKIAQAGADAEEAAFKLAELNGAMVQGALDVNDVRLAWQDAGENGLRVLLDEMDPAVVKSKEFSQQLGDLLSSGRVTKEEFQGIAETVRIYRTEMGDVVPVVEDVGTAMGGLGGPVRDLDELLSGLGVTTKEDAIAGINDLSAALADGRVPPEQMATLIDNLEAKYKDLALLGIPEVDKALRLLNDKYETTNGILDTNLSKTTRLAAGIALLGDDFEDTSDVIADFNVTLPKTEPPFQSLSTSMGEFGIKTIDAEKQLGKLTRLMESGQAPVRQMVEAIRKQRDELEAAGQLTPEVAKKLNELEKQSLANATAADRAALGFKGLFDGFQTGIPAIDKFLGSFGGIFDSITGVLGGLGGKVGGFFSGLTDSIGGLFNTGGQKGGDNFFAGISGALGGLGGLFGNKGQESGTEFVQSVSTGVGAVVPMLTTVGTEGAGGFASGIMQTLGGGGGFDVTSLFSGVGQQAADGFILGPLTTVPAATGEIMAEAAQVGGGGFLSTLGGLFGGGGGGEGGGGILSSIFSGAGGGAGGNFLSGLTQGLSSGMGAAKSGIQGIFQAGLSLIPVVGPILSQFAGPLFKGITAIGGKIAGFFSGIFGGVSAEEKEAREFANSLNDTFRGMLDTASLAEAASAAAGTANDQWAVSNIAVRDAYMAVGMSAEQAAAASTRLSDAARATPAEAEAAAAEIKAVTDRVQEAMSITGLSLTELRSTAINDAKSMGISVEEAFTNLTTSVTESVTTAAGTQCEAQTAAATCGVNSAEQVSSAVEVSTKKQVEDTKAAQEEIVTLTTDTGKKIVEGVADTTEVIQTKWEESTSATKAKLQDLQVQSDISFTAMAASARVNTDQIQLVMGTGFQSIEMQLGGIASAASSSFGSMAASAVSAARDSVDAFEDMEDELVGNSVFPDTAFSASKSLLSIADAAKVSAAQVSTTFAGAGDEVQKKIAALKGGGTEVAMARTMDRTVLGQPDLRPRAVRGGGGPPGQSGGGGNDMTVQVVMPNGQVLAETVVKEMPRVLGNKGLRRF